MGSCLRGGSKGADDATIKGPATLMLSTGQKGIDPRNGPLQGIKESSILQIGPICERVAAGGRFDFREEEEGEKSKARRNRSA